MMDTSQLILIAGEISLRLIGVASSVSLAGTFLQSRSWHLPQSRDRSKTQDKSKGAKGGGENEGRDEKTERREHKRMSKRNQDRHGQRTVH